MDCERFLDGYSDFRDGLLPLEASREFEAHLRSCGACARYDRVVDRGARLCRDLPELEPSSDFAARLRERIDRGEPDAWVPGRSSSELSASAALSIAAVLAVAAWLPVLQGEDGTPERLPAVAARAPQPAAEHPPLFVSAPALTHGALLDRGWTQHDEHLLFGYIPLGAPVAIRTAALD